MTGAQVASQPNQEVLTKRCTLIELTGRVLIIVWIVTRFQRFQLDTQRLVLRILRMPRFEIGAHFLGMRQCLQYAL